MVLNLCSPHRWWTVYRLPICEKKPPTASWFCWRISMARALQRTESSITHEKTLTACYWRDASIKPQAWICRFLKPISPNSFLQIKTFNFDGFNKPTMFYFSALTGTFPSCYQLNLQGNYAQDLQVMCDISRHALKSCIDFVAKSTVDSYSSATICETNKIVVRKL